MQCVRVYKFKFYISCTQSFIKCTCTCIHRLQNFMNKKVQGLNEEEWLMDIIKFLKNKKNKNKYYMKKSYLIILRREMFFKFNFRHLFKRVVTVRVKYGKPDTNTKLLKTKKKHSFVEKNQLFQNILFLICFSFIFSI